MAEISNPCYYCNDRKVGCHSSCDPFITWGKENKQKRELVRKGSNSIADQYLGSKRGYSV